MVLPGAQSVRTAKNHSRDFTSVIAVYSRTYMIAIIDSGTIDALVSESKFHQRHRRRTHAGSNFPEDFSVISLIFPP